MVCWLVCAGWVCGTRTFLNAVWCFGCIEMDWLACDCVQLFVSSFCAPSGWGGSDFFFVVIFGRQHEPLLVCGGLFFCWVSGFSRPVSLVLLKRFVESLILAQDERWRRA